MSYRAIVIAGLVPYPGGTRPRNWGYNRVVGRDFLRIPDGAPQGGIGLGGHSLKTGNAGKGSNDPGSVTELLFGQIGANLYADTAWLQSSGLPADGWA